MKLALALWFIWDGAGLCTGIVLMVAGKPWLLVVAASSTPPPSANSAAWAH